MYFFNLSLGEFLGLLGVLSGVITALYLLDRTRRKVQVATLRFWVHSESPSAMRHRRRIQQPWSLLLQLLSLLLLLLALAQLRWGSPANLSRDHVLIVDTSAVMGAVSGSETWMDRSRQLAQAWLAKVPSGDRVMLVRADALPTAATAFESNRQVIEEALAALSPSASALRLESALRFAQQAQAAQGKGPGEIVYAGPGWTAEEDTGFAASLPNLRVLPVAAELDNVGLRKISLRRSAERPGYWEAYLTVRNFGREFRLVPMAALFGGAVVAQRQLRLSPVSEQSFTVEFRAEAMGVLEILLRTRDSFPGDDRAALELPALAPARVVIYSLEPELWRPVFSGAPGIQAEYLPPAAYRPDVEAAMVVLDSIGPPPPTKAAALWIDPPPQSAVRSAGRKQGLTIDRWHNDHPLGAGLRAAGARLEFASLLEPSAGDIRVAEAGGGVVILARPAARLVALGFHPLRSALRFQLTTPLLFANILRWLAPSSLLSWELTAESAGSVAVPLEMAATADQLTVKMDGAGDVPFSIDGRTLRFFSGAPGIVRVQDGRRELVYSLTLPEMATAAWKPPAAARQGVPAALEAGPAARELWPWLAVAGALGLALEWSLFGRSRRRLLTPVSARHPLRRAS